jgi:hypothetical protein
VYFVDAVTDGRRRFACLPDARRQKDERADILEVEFGLFECGQ